MCGLLFCLSGCVALDVVEFVNPRRAAESELDFRWLPQPGDEARAPSGQAIDSYITVSRIQTSLSEQERDSVRWSKIA